MGGAEPLTWIYELVYTLLNTHQRPFRVEGELTPRVTVGTSGFVHGPQQTPIRTSLLRTAALARQLYPVLNVVSYLPSADDGGAQARGAGC